MALDPQCREFLDKLAAGGGKQLHEMTPEEARALDLTEFGVPLEEIARVENRAIPGPAGPIPVRIYTPVLDKTLPALVYFHGGGFVVCGLDSHDRECRTLANQSGCVVIAVDYRLAPEHKFPAAHDDAWAATKYVAEHAAEFGADASRIAVGGDSAGGNLATAVSMMARDQNGPRIAFQLLVYPCTEANATEGSMKEYGEGHFLSAAAMDWFYGHYFSSPEDRLHPHASPGYVSDLRNLPPAFVLTAECDPLRDQGEAYARKLQAAGVEVSHRRYEGMIHPFFTLGGAFDTTLEAHEDAAFELRMALSSGQYARP